MDDSLQHQLEQAMSEFTKQHESLMKARDEVMSLSVTVRSKDRAVEVTVGSQGEASGLRFLNNKYKEMSGQALATSILEALAKARQEIADQVAARFESVSGGGLGVAGKGMEGFDLDRLLEPLGAEGLLTKQPGSAENRQSSTREDGGSRHA
ncbi:YbaB/EbfC family nucleoid-associated protein [Streptomyces sp. NPDC006923]|uniref:YbaB/EbfC family nucleoid-associated protein n=1 Tax=Streptomyces sp. NPDC006923 TaxID=3155355 RepID=UPI0033C9853C